MMRIGDLAESTGTAVETIRFYEREGLIPAARRAENNYRVYTDAHVERLAFIRHCRNLDMTLDEIRTLLRFKDAPTRNCGDVNALLDAVLAVNWHLDLARREGWDVSLEITALDELAIALSRHEWPSNESEDEFAEAQS